MEQKPIPSFTYFDAEKLCAHLHGDTSPATLKATDRHIQKEGLLPAPLTKDLFEEDAGVRKNVFVHSLKETQRKREMALFGTLYKQPSGEGILYTNDMRKGRRWVTLPKNYTSKDIEKALYVLLENVAKNITLFPQGALLAACRTLANAHQKNDFIATKTFSLHVALEAFHAPAIKMDFFKGRMGEKLPQSVDFSHLERLEAESIHIFREVMAEAENPVMLYSVGKDSAVMLHLARKAFYPSPPPFPLLHVDTRWKFQEMYDFRAFMAAESKMELLVHINPDGVEKNINPFDHGSALHTDIMKTQGLKQALDHYKFDVAFGGARREEEKSRAKERVFSFRNAHHAWDPKNQRPELWNLYNCRKNPGESIRVFPLSNWTELDIWQYIYREKIPIVPLYFAKERPYINRDGFLMMVDDDRLPLYENEKIHTGNIRFRTLGCYPLTGAIQSDAADLPSIILELLNTRTSERQGRAIDTDSAASMEKKKKEGYF